MQLLPDMCNRRPWLSLLGRGGKSTATNLELGRDKMIMSLRNSELHSKTLSQAAKRVGKLLKQSRRVRELYAVVKGEICITS